MGGHPAGDIYLSSDRVTSLTRAYLVKLYYVLPCSLIRLLTSDLISLEPQSTKPLSRKTTLPSLSIRYETGMPNIVLPGDLSFQVKQYLRRVAIFLDERGHKRRLFFHIDQQHLQTVILVVPVQPIQGRQLLPTGGSPGCPEHHHYNVSL